VPPPPPTAGGGQDGGVGEEGKNVGEKMLGKNIVTFLKNIGRILKKRKYCPTKNS
jgi:hypothetical protein